VPTVLWNVAPGWWVLADTNATIDWEQAGRVSRRTGVEIGRVVRRTWGVSVKPEIPSGAPIARATGRSSPSSPATAALHAAK
jgi:hypothetical protein